MNQGHRRNRKRRNAIVLIAGLAAGGVGLALVNMQANATDAPSATTRAASPLSCPSVADRLPDVPRQARAEVDRNLRLLQTQITEAGNRLAATRGQGGPDFVQNAILGPLKDKRTATVDRIAIAISRTGAPRPQGLSSLAACTLAGAGQGQKGQGQQGRQGQTGQGQKGQGQKEQGASPSPAAGNGPVPEDFVDITKVAPNVPARPRNSRNASKGAFTTRCGVNAEGRHNSDNVIVAPGVGNGAHHTHDYVGAIGVDAFTTDDTLAAADTTCSNGDRSTYYWPVLRDRNGAEEADAGKPGGGAEGNIGKILTPTSASLTFVGSPRGKVVAMPRFLRIITVTPRRTRTAAPTPTRPGPAPASRTASSSRTSTRSAPPAARWSAPSGSRAAGRTEHRQRQPPQPCRLRRRPRQLPVRLQGGPAARAAPHLQRPGRQHRLRRGQLPRVAAQAHHRPWRLHQRHARAADEEGGHLHQLRPPLRLSPMRPQCHSCFSNQWWA